MPGAKTDKAVEAVVAEQQQQEVVKTTKSGKTPAPPKPDENKFKARTDEASKKIEAKKAEIKALSEKIDSLSTGKEEYEQQKAELYERMNLTKQKQSEILEKKQELRKQERNSKMAARDQAKELKGLEKEANQMNEETIDQKIRELEYQMNVRSMPLKEEKAMMMEIKTLKKKRPEAQRVAAEYEKLKAQSEAAGLVDPTKPAGEVIQSLEEQHKTLKKQQDEEFAAIQELKKGREGKVSGVKEFIDSKKTLRADVDALIAERNAIYEEKRSMQKAFNTWEREDRLENQRKWTAEQARRDAEWEAEKARRELEKPNPFLDETTLLEQTIDYCKNLMPRVEQKEEETAEISHNQPEGAKILVSKKERDAEMYFSATKKKALKKKGTEKKSQSIKHTADTFSIFAKLKVAAPMTTSDLEPLVEKLSTTLSALQVKANAWEAVRKEKVEAALANGTLGVEEPAEE